MKTLALILFAVLAGCTTGVGGLRMKSGTQLQPPKNAQEATTINEGQSLESFTIPVGSRILVTDTEGTPEKAGSKVTELVLSKDMLRSIQTNTTQASVSPPRAPDQTVALAKVTNTERRPFLFAAIALSIGAGVLAYFRLMPLARLAGLAAGVCLVFWWAIGNEKLLTWCFIILAVVTGAYFVYSDWRKKRLQGTIATTEQSVKEFAIDHPAQAMVFREEYLDVNRDEAHKREALKAKIDTSYIEQRTAEKLGTAIPKPAL